MRKQFSKSACLIADKDEKAVMLIGDISHYLLKEYEDKYPNRFYNLGICEQSLVGLASGLALSGMRPIIHTIAPFCVERAYEQIKIDLCYQKTDVTIVSVGSSFDYAHLGCTHHCYEDVAILRALPNIQIFVPGTSKEFDSLLNSTWDNGFPKYFKLSNKEHSYSIDVKPFEHNIIQYGNSKKIAIVNGHLLDEVMSAVSKDDTVIYLSSLSNITEESSKQISDLIKNKKVFIFEENSQIGGLGDLIFEISSQNNISIDAKKIGIPNKFLTNYGKPEEHRKHIGLTKENFTQIMGDT